MILTPKEIESAIKDGQATASVNDKGTRMTLALRPTNSSRTFLLEARIISLVEL